LEFEYTEQEKRRNKILKYNLDESLKLQNDEELHRIRNEADSNISSSKKLLQSLGYDVADVDKNVEERVTANKNNQNQQCLKSEEELYEKANQAIPEEVKLEDILSRDQIASVWMERERIEQEFSEQTGITNSIDLKFLLIATTLQTAKSLIFPYIAKVYHYGESIDASKRLSHNDNKIKEADRKSKDSFKEKYQKRHGNGNWINLLYQTPPYDITTGSVELGINMGGKYHRLPTLGHDPVLGWIFGTADILTDVITFTDFSSYQVTRVPKMRITNEPVDIGELFYNSFLEIRDDYFNLPAALFAQYCHLKSDIHTKLGLPIPILTVFNKNLATKLYQEQYDFLCFTRDIKITGISLAVSVIVDMIIGLFHQFYRKPEEDEELYEIRTRKILLISSVIASTSSIIGAAITKSAKQLDVGQIVNVCRHLFFDIRFILNIKREFIQKEIDSQFQREYEKTKKLYFNT